MSPDFSVAIETGMRLSEQHSIMDNGPMMIAELRLKTSAEHSALERSLPPLDADFNLRIYIWMIQTFEAFVSQWEDFGQKVCPSSMLAAFQARRRSVLLQEDLAFFGIEPLTERPEVPVFARPSPFVGAMYVMEGSTLGGQIISRHLEKTLGLEDGGGYRYFRGHGPETGRMWKDFCSQVEELSPDLDSEAVVAGARQMFCAFHDWVNLRKKVNEREYRSNQL